MEIILKRLTETGDFANEFVVLTQQKPYTVGRRPYNDIVLNHKSVSRKHCIFHRKPDGLFIEILKNNARLRVNHTSPETDTMVRLYHGDLIDIGHNFNYQVEFKAQDPEIKIEPATDNSESQNSSLAKLHPVNISIKSEPPDLDLFKTGNCESNSEESKHDINIPPPPDLDSMKPGINGSTFIEVKHQIALSPLPIGNIKRELEEDDQNLDSRQKAAKLTINETCSQALQRVSDMGQTIESANCNLPTGIEIKDEPQDVPPNEIQLSLELNSPSQPPNLDVAMQIYEEYEPKPLLLPFESQENFTSVSRNEFSVKTRIESSEPLVNGDFEQEIKAEILDLPDESGVSNLPNELRNLKLPNEFKNFNLPIETENFNFPNIVENLNIPKEVESDFNQNTFHNSIKIENPDIPSTNVSLFRNSSPEIDSNENSRPPIPENRTNQSFDSQTPKNLPGQNFTFQSSDLDSEMQIEIEEADVKSFLPFLAPIHDSNRRSSLEDRLQNFQHILNLENRKKDEIPASIPEKKPVLKVRSDLGMFRAEPKSVFESPIENQLMTLVENQCEPLIENQFEYSTEFRIEASNPDPNNLGIRIKEEWLDPSNESQIENYDNVRMGIKKEIVDPVGTTEELMSKEIKRNRELGNFGGAETAQERIDPLETENLLGETVNNMLVKQENSNNSENFNDKINSESNRNFELLIKQEAISVSDYEYQNGPNEIRVGTESSDTIDYSKLVTDEIEFHEEKPVPSYYGNLNNYVITEKTISELEKNIKNESEGTKTKKREDGKNKCNSINIEEIEGNRKPDNMRGKRGEKGSSKGSFSREDSEAEVGKSDGRGDDIKRREDPRRKVMDVKEYYKKKFQRERLKEDSKLPKNSESQDPQNNQSRIIDRNEAKNEERNEEDFFRTSIEDWNRTDNEEEKRDPNNTEERDSRLDSTDRNYLGARVLDDYEDPEERGRSLDPRNRFSSTARGGKKKLNYKDYLKRRANSGTTASGGSTDGARNNGTVPLTTFRESRQHSKDAQTRIQASGVPIPPFHDPRLLNQPLANQAPPMDPRFMARGNEGFGVIPNLEVAAGPTFMNHPILQPQTLFNQEAVTNLVGVPRQAYMDYRLQTQTPLNQGFVPNLGIQYPIIDAPVRDPRFVPRVMEVTGVPPSIADPRISVRRGSQPQPIGDLYTKDSGFKSKEVKDKKVAKNSSMKHSRKETRRLEAQPSTSGREMVRNPLKVSSKSDIKAEGRIADRASKENRFLKVIEQIRSQIPREPLESENLTDVLLMPIFSWDPERFKGSNGGSPIEELRRVRAMPVSFRNYNEYCNTVSQLLLLDLSYQIQDSFIFGEKKAVFNKCHLIEDIIASVWIEAYASFLVSFFLTITVPIIDEITQPVAGDLLTITIVYENQELSIFGFIQKIVYEEPSNSPGKIVAYLVLVREQEFNIAKCKIKNVKPILNLDSSLEKAKAVNLIQQSPLLDYILCPNPTMNPTLERVILRQESLVSKQPLDTKQLTVMTKIIKSYENAEPRICVVEGPAGTGKTTIVVNTILELLYKQPQLENDPLRILVSASTNVELEEIILRLRNILDNSKLEKSVLKMVIVGPDEDKRNRFKDLNLSRFAKNHIDSDIQQFHAVMGSKSAKEQMDVAKKEINHVQEKFMAHGSVQCGLQMKLLKMYYDIAENGRNVKQMTPQERKELQGVGELTFLLGANLIFCSVPNLFHPVMEKFRKGHSFPICIVDEAPQILEIDTLKILSMKGSTLVLLGDNNKKPSGYDHSRVRFRHLAWGNSLFYRIERSFQVTNKSPVIRLPTQYRISVPIESWLNKADTFKMYTLRNLVRQEIPFPLHSLRIFKLSYTEDFIDNEAVFASRVMHCIASFGDLRRLERSISVGVIISDIDAKERVEQEIKNKMEEIIPGKAQIFNIEVDTIDGFLNHEKDIILASCIRNKHLVTLAGFQRFYATLTRAKHCLIIYGRFAKVSKFRQPCHWHKLIDHAKNVVNVSAYAESTELRRDLIK